ncbi:hypothetical protein MXB_2787 [Myxobolus squamalis]|nr:hypothetical protein MXB_2787 [Myxobolus squamalis]
MTIFGKFSTFVFGSVFFHAYNKFSYEKNSLWSTNYHINISCEEKSSLRLAMVYFRHGRRTPILKKSEVAEAEWPLEWVENDLPHTMFDYEIKNANLYPKTLDASLFDQLYTNFGALKGGAGQGLLTKFGQEDAFDLGQRLRLLRLQNTSKFCLAHSKHTFTLTLYTTFIKRTVKSMRCVLAGMFDREGSHVADVYSRPIDFEYYFPNYEYCLRYKMICREALMQEKEASHLGPLQLKLAIGFLLNDLDNAINNYISGDNWYFDSSLYLYSAHDTTLIAIMLGLGCYDGVWPEVSSYFTVELHSIDNEWLIRFIYNDTPIIIKESSNGFIPLHKFKSLIKKNLLKNTDFQDVCSIEDI